jgi:hypothetical protein
MAAGNLPGAIAGRKSLTSTPINVEHRLGEWPV